MRTVPNLATLILAVSVAIASGGVLTQPALAQPGEIVELHKRVRALEDARKYAEASTLCEQLLKMVEKQFGKHHVNTGTVLNDLGGLYDRQSRFAEAGPLHERALAIAETTLGPINPKIAPNLNALARHYVALGQYSEAEQLAKRAVAILEKAHGPNHPNVALFLRNLAVLYQAQGRNVDAEPLLIRNLSIRITELSVKHSDLVGLEEFLPGSTGPIKRDASMKLAELEIFYSAFAENQINALLEKYKFVSTINSDYHPGSDERPRLIYISPNTDLEAYRSEVRKLGPPLELIADVYKFVQENHNASNGAPLPDNSLPIIDLNKGLLLDLPCMQTPVKANCAKRPECKWQYGSCVGSNG